MRILDYRTLAEHYIKIWYMQVYKISNGKNKVFILDLTYKGRSITQKPMHKSL